MPRRTPRTALDRVRTFRRLPGFLKTASVCVLIAGLVSPITQSAAAAATSASPAAAANDYCGGQCSDILPPGENGNATLAQILLNQTFGTQPGHAEDQLGPYANLATGYKGLSDTTINNFFNDASFGVPSDQVASTEKPNGRSDVTIVRDKKTGVPHITGTTRSGWAALAAIWWMGREEVLEAKTVCSPHSRSTSATIWCLRARSSNTASTTMSTRWKPE